MHNSSTFYHLHKTHVACFKYVFQILYNSGIGSVDVIYLNCL